MLPAQPSWKPVGNIIIVEDPGDLYNSHRGHMASSERAPGAKIEGVLNLPGVKEKIGQKVEKNDGNQFVVDLYKQSTTFHRCQREELEKNGSNQFVLDLYVNGSVERDKNVTKKSSGNKYRFLSITKILSALVNSFFMLFLLLILILIPIITPNLSLSPSSISMIL